MCERPRKLDGEALGKPPARPEDVIRVWGGSLLSTVCFSHRVKSAWSTSREDPGRKKCELSKGHNSLQHLGVGWGGVRFPRTWRRMDALW